MVTFSNTILFRRPGDEVFHFHRVEYFYPHALGISTVIPELGKIFSEEGCLVQQLSSIMKTSYIFKETSVNIFPEIDGYRKPRL